MDRMISQTAHGTCANMRTMIERPIGWLGPPLPDSRYAVARLVVAVLLMTIGTGGMYFVPVVMPQIQAEFGVSRADASLPYALLMLGFGPGALVMGRLMDRFSLTLPIVVGAASIGLGYVLAAQAGSLLAFSAAHGLLIGLLGCASTFSPLLADTSLWWTRRRGIAVAVCASGNFLGGAIWPPLVQRLVEAHGWRWAYTTLGIASALMMLALALFMRRRPSLAASQSTHEAAHPSGRPFGLGTPIALGLLMVAGVACCVAMAMPQVHIVSYCADLGYGPARGAQMLSLMLACGIVSRLACGLLSDRIGGLRTLLIGSALQCAALALFLPFDALVSLYVICALFGLAQGGIIPAYTVVIREHFPAARAGTYVGAVVMCTLLGMASGSWMSGKLLDLTGSYRAAFWNGIAWNVLNFAIVLFLLLRLRRHPGIRGFGGALSTSAAD
jgi:MFS family permease